MLNIPILTKPPEAWTSQDVLAFCAHAPELAADGDFATKNSALHEMACAFVEKRNGCCDN
jgi:hypothetical protein